ANALPDRGKRPQTASSTKISSSNSSQRKARPFRRNLTFSRRFCGALASNGYLAAGKLTNRPSASSKQTRRPSTPQRVAAVSVFVWTLISISFPHLPARDAELVHQFQLAPEFGAGDFTSQ